MKNFGQYQDEIYFAGLRGSFPNCPSISRRSRRRPSRRGLTTIVSYVQGGCGDERTQDLNVSAFRSGASCRG